MRSLITPTFTVSERSKGTALPDHLVARRTEFSVKTGMHIPHNQMPLDEGVLRKDQAASAYARQMGHELRTPLNVIIGLCQYLQRERETPLTDAQRDSVVRMERNAHALSESINRLLEAVRTGKIG